MLFMHFALTFKLHKNIFYPVGRKKLTDGRILRSGEAVIGIIFNDSIGCLAEYSMSPSLLYPCIREVAKQVKCLKCVCRV